MILSNESKKWNRWPTIRRVVPRLGAYQENPLDHVLGSAWSRIQTPRNKGLALLFWIVTIVVVVLRISVKAFTTFASYDDEGYFLMTTHHMLNGHRLYDEIIAFYGPAYFGGRWLIHAMLGFANTNDVQRIFLVVFSSLTALVGGLIVVRATGRWVIGGMTSLMIVSHLIIHQNPGHPETFISFLLATIPVIASFGREGRSAATMAFLGAVCGVLLAIKINVGLFAIVGTLLALTSSLGRNRSMSLLGHMMTGATVLLPIALLRGELSTV